MKGVESKAKPLHLRLDLALHAGLPGLAYAWRLSGWKPVELGLVWGDMTAVFSSETGVSLGDVEPGMPRLVFRDVSVFMAFIEQGKPSFRPNGPVLEWATLLRFLIGAARLQPTLRGSFNMSKTSEDRLLLHGRVSLWTAILGLQRLTQQHGNWRGALAQYSGRTLGFFLEDERMPLAGLSIDLTGCVELIEDCELVVESCNTLLIFRNEIAMAEAVQHTCPSTEMIGDGRLEVRGLVPLADIIAAALDEVDGLLNR